MHATNGKRMTLQEAKDRPVIYSLDCWQVNLTKDTLDAIVQHIPGADKFRSRMMIPAKGTGKKQINDTNAHTPFKKAYKQFFNKWFGGEIIKFKKAKDDGKITIEQYKDKVKALTSWPCLRDNILGLIYRAIYDSFQSPKKYDGVERTVRVRKDSKIYTFRI